MTKHTPSTTDIRIRYERYREQEQQRGADGVTPVTPGEFERWLAAEVAAAKAEAWDEGQKSGLRYADRAIKAHEIGRPDLPGPPSPNPYRTERATDEQG